MMDRAKAEALALQALGWLAGQDELIGGFLMHGGLAPADLRARAADPEMLASVLDFLLLEDAHVMGFCDAQGIGYTLPAQARAALPGGAQFHWT